MFWSELKEKEKAPQSGWILGYTRKKVIFHAYDTISELEKELEGQELLELHLFNEQKEYRCLATRSKRFPDRAIETIAEFAEEDGITVYEEKVLLDKNMVSDDVLKRKKITIINHVSYTEENGMAVIDNYRLKI